MHQPFNAYLIWTCMQMRRSAGSTQECCPQRREDAVSSSLGVIKKKEAFSDTKARNDDGSSV
jgi:hypothetical protein